MISDLFSVWRLCFVLLILPTPLSAQKKLLKKAYTLEQGKQYELAAQQYMEVLYRNASRTEAVEGLERTAQQVVDQKLAYFFTTRNSQDLRKAVTTFEEVLDYQEVLNYFNVAVQIPQYYFDDYEKGKTELALQARVLELEGEHQSKEDNYQRALELFEKDQWIDAAHVFQRIENYKQSSAYLDSIKSKAVRIAIIENNKNRFSAEHKLRNSLLAEILQFDNPLIRIISRENLDQVIEEQKLGLSGVFDESSVAQLGKLLGVEMILLTQVINYDFIPGATKSQSQTAYRLAKRKVFYPTTQNSNSIKDYFPIEYEECYKEDQLEMSLQYQLIQVSTAEIRHADIIYQKVEVATHYATYQGDVNLLYPSNGQSIYIEGKEREEFLSLFLKDTTPPNESELRNEAQKKISIKVAQSLDNYFSK